MILPIILIVALILACILMPNLVLVIVCILFGPPVLLLFWTYSVIKSFWKVQPKTGFRNLNKKSLVLASAVDLLGAAVGVDILNDTLIKPASPYSFGRNGEAIFISQDIGYNLTAGTLTRTGWIVAMMLDFIDPGHAQNSIGEPVTQTLSNRARVIIWACIVVVLAGIIFLIV